MRHQRASDSTAILELGLKADQYGSSMIRVSIEDGGVDNDLNTTENNARYTELFELVVLPVNDTPSFTALSDVTMLEDAGLQSIGLSGISAGPGETQPLRLTAVSDNLDLIPDPTVVYTAGESTGTLQFTSEANLSGVATITLQIEDGGLDDDLATTEDNESFAQTFEVVVEPVNDDPTLDVLSDVRLPLDTGEQVVSLAGITAGPLESQPLRVSVSSSKPELIPTPAVTYSSAEPTGELRFTPVANESGISIITVSVEDGGFDNDLSTLEDNAVYEDSFIVSVNDHPLIDPLNDLTLIEDAGLQVVALSGIMSGGSDRPVEIIAVSSNPELVSDMHVAYVDGQLSGELSFASNPDQYGRTTISVSVVDGGVDQDLQTTKDNLITTEEFEVVVTPVNDRPEFNMISGIRVDQDYPEFEIDISGINAGGGEDQPLRFSARSSDANIVWHPWVKHSVIDGTGSFDLWPLLHKHGDAVITVSLEDGGLDRNLSTPDDNLIYTRELEVSVTKPNEWRNDLDPKDANVDGYVSPLDALIVISRLNLRKDLELSDRRPQDEPRLDTDGDGVLSPSDAIRVINYLNGDSDSLVLEVVPTDEAGNRIEEIAVGESFYLSLMTEDIRRMPLGVFASYLDVYYDHLMVEPSGDASYHAPYVNGLSNDFSTKGVIDEWGAFAGVEETGGGRYLVSQIPMVATNVGDMLFKARKADDTPQHDVLAYGTTETFTETRVEYLSSPLTITVGEADGEFVGSLDVQESKPTTESLSLDDNTINLFAETPLIDFVGAVDQYHLQLATAMQPQREYSNDSEMLLEELDEELLALLSDR